MIVKLSQTVCQSLQNIDRIDKLKADASALEYTLSSLQKVQAVAAQLQTYMDLFQTRLPSSTIQFVRENIARILIDLSVSEDNFESEINQRKQLNSIESRLKGIVEKSILPSWRAYVEEQLREPVELLTLVSNLPEIAAQTAQYQGLIKNLHSYISKPPTNQEQLAYFDQCLQDLKHHLGNIGGLNSSVKIFLGKVLNNQATLADLNDEVIAWCRQGKRAQTFIIAFTARS